MAVGERQRYKKGPGLARVNQLGLWSQGKEFGFILIVMGSHGRHLVRAKMTLFIILKPLIGFGMNC